MLESDIDAAGWMVSHRSHVIYSNVFEYGNRDPAYRPKNPGY
jgi:hypothetical protein